MITRPGQVGELPLLAKRRSVGRYSRSHDFGRCGALQDGSITGELLLGAVLGIHIRKKFGKRSKLVALFRARHATTNDFCRNEGSHVDTYALVGIGATGRTRTPSAATSPKYAWSKKSA
jgi:hypothetical protein